MMIFLVLVLATWRLSRLLAMEDGPFDLIFKLRKFVGDGFWGKLMDCPFCSSIWISFILCLLVINSFSGLILYGLAGSGGACLLILLENKINPIELNEKKESIGF